MRCSEGEVVNYPNLIQNDLYFINAVVARLVIKLVSKLFAFILCYHSLQQYKLIRKTIQIHSHHSLQQYNVIVMIFLSLHLKNLMLTTALRSFCMVYFLVFLKKKLQFNPLDCLHLNFNSYFFLFIIIGLGLFVCFQFHHSISIYWILYSWIWSLLFGFLIFILGHFVKKLVVFNFIIQFKLIVLCFLIWFF